jgi:hypothetical protein
MKYKKSLDLMQGIYGEIFLLRQFPAVYLRDTKAGRKGKQASDKKSAGQDAPIQAGRTPK